MLSCLLLTLVVSELAVSGICGLNVSFVPSHVTVNVDEQETAAVLFEGTPEELLKIQQHNWTVFPQPSNVLGAKLDLWCGEIGEQCSLNVTVYGKFLGYGRVSLWRSHASGSKEEATLKVTVLRQDTVLNKIFIAFVATVVSLNYINMGCALDLEVVKAVLKRPIGPAVGFVCQFVIMPAVAYGVGQLLFTDPVLRLGLFTFGCSPGGGASNMWTVLLGGNLNLSITMTFVSTIASLFTIPLWLFTLGKTIVKGTNIVFPYQNILTSLASLTIPIGIGILIQRRFPKVASRSKRILAPVSIILIISIIVLASIANFYMFYMLTWRMVVAASLSVWTGFAAGVLVSLVFRFPSTDIIAIAVETGIQNSGIAFVLLTYSLTAPASDMASVVPVAGSIITPIPLFLIYCYQRLRNRCCRNEDFELHPINSKLKVESKGIDNLGHSDVGY